MNAREIAECIARDTTCAQGEFHARVNSIIPYLTEYAAEIERLRGENTALRSNVVADRCKIERLRAALKPFADALTRAEKDEPNSVANRLECCRTDITLYEFAKAREALSHEQTVQTKGE